MEISRGGAFGALSMFQKTLTMVFLINSSQILRCWLIRMCKNKLRSILFCGRPLHVPFFGNYLGRIVAVVLVGAYIDLLRFLGGPKTYRC